MVQVACTGERGTLTTVCRQTPSWSVKSTSSEDAADPVTVCQQRSVSSAAPSIVRWRHQIAAWHQARASYGPCLVLQIVAEASDELAGEVGVVDVVDASEGLFRSSSRLSGVRCHRLTTVSGTNLHKGLWWQLHGQSEKPRRHWAPSS